MTPTPLPDEIAALLAEADGHCVVHNAEKRTSTCIECRKTWPCFHRRATAALRATQAELTAARLDGERLEWLEKRPQRYWRLIPENRDGDFVLAAYGDIPKWITHETLGNTVRAAIDAARAAGGESS